MPRHCARHEGSRDKEDGSLNSPTDSVAFLSSWALRCRLSCLLFCVGFFNQIIPHLLKPVGWPCSRQAKMSLNAERVGGTFSGQGPKDTKGQQAPQTAPSRWKEAKDRTHLELSINCSD